MILMILFIWAVALQLHIRVENVDRIYGLYIISTDWIQLIRV